MAPFWQSLLAPPKFSLANMSALHQQLQRTSVVSERNRATVVDALRTTAELVLWGDQNDPALFEFFLEKNILGIFWRLLEQWDTPSSVKVQILQTLSILISNIEAGPSIYYILSNDHINQLIRHPFDFSNEELLAHYVSLLKAIALRLDRHTVQFFIGDAPPVSDKRDVEISSASPSSPAAAPPAAAARAAPARSSTGGIPPSPPLTTAPARRPNAEPASAPRYRRSDPAPAAVQPPTRFALFEAALTLWTHDERMVRTAVRTIVLCVCRLQEPSVQAFVRDSAVLPQVLIAALCAEHSKLGDAICACYAFGSHHTPTSSSAPASAPAAAAASAPAAVAASAPVAAVDAALQGMLDETYFLNDLMESAQTGLATRLVSALLSGFVLPLLVQPLVPGHLVGGASQPHAYAHTDAAVGLNGGADIGGDAQWGTSVSTGFDGNLSPRSGSPPNSVGNQTPGGGNSHSRGGAATVPELLALLLMSVCVSTVSHAPLLAALATLFLHPQLELASVATPVDAPCVLPLFDDEARHTIDDQQQSSGRGALPGGRGQAARIGTGGEGPIGSASRSGAAGLHGRNALRASLFARLSSSDERIVLLACACVLSAMRSPAVHSETLRQAFLLPVRRVRASCLLERLLATRVPDADAEASPKGMANRAAGSYTGQASPDRLVNGAAGSCTSGFISSSTERGSLRSGTRDWLDALGVRSAPAGEAAQATQAAQGKVPMIVEYSEAAVTALLGVLSRSAAGGAGGGASGREGVGGVGVSSSGAARGASIHPPVSSDGCGVRLLMVQLAIEVLLELLGGSHGPAPLQPHHWTALHHAHDAAAAAVGRSLHGPCASEIGSLAEYEQAQMPPQGTAVRLVALLADPSILLPAGLLPHLPLGRRHARTELEASRVVLQTFLLLRQLRNELTSTPDDLNSLAPPVPVDLQRGARLALEATAQLVPCEISGRGAEPAVPCLLVLPHLEPADPPLDPQVSWTRRGFLLLVAPGPAAEQHHTPAPPPPPPRPAPPPPPPPPPPVDPRHLPGGSVSGRTSDRPPAGAARPTPTPAQRTPVQHASVVLALPLNALRIERETATAAHLAVLVTRPLAARDGCGAAGGGRAEHVLSFAEPWRCSIAKAHLERASAAVRIEQKQRLAALLGPPAASSEAPRTPR